MSYLVLARKWRPQTFADLIGQEHVSQTLKNAIDGGRVAHAFLFTGARGVGKTSSARILAKALNCDAGPAAEPCNACPTCKEITDGNSVDVFEIDGASNTGVDDIRELRDTIKYLPSRSRFKIFIIDEVHMLSTNAFNALLKTLEEPPPHVKFIFATTEPHKVPVTILSRCQRFDFKRISLPMIVARLRYIVDREEITISDASLAVVARKGDGSMRDSLSTLDQVLAFCGANVADDDVVTLLGVVDRRLLHETVSAVFARDTVAVLDIVKRVDAYGANMRNFCQELIECFRHLLILQAAGDVSDLLDVSEGELAELRAQAKAVTLIDLQRQLTLLLKAENDMAHSSFPRLIMEMALIKMATLVPVVPVDDLIARLKVLEGKTGGVVASSSPVWDSGPSRQAGQAPSVPKPQQPQQPPPKTPAPTPPGAAADAARPARPAGEKDWEGFVDFVKGKKQRLASQLNDARPLMVSSTRLEIGFPSGVYWGNLSQGEGLDELKNFAAAFFGEGISVKVTAASAGGGDVPLSLAEKKSLDITTRQKQMREEAETHPVVSAALEIFGGRLEEVEELKGSDS